MWPIIYIYIYIQQLQRRSICLLQVMPFQIIRKGILLKPLNKYDDANN